MKTAELNFSWFLCSGLFGQVEHFSSYVGDFVFYSLLQS